MAERAYLSMCTIYRDQAPLLREWIEFHRLVGVERFFLYNNFSEDDHREVLASYIRDGTVVVHDWPIDFPPAIGTAFTHCVTEHAEDSRWIAFIDLDEFLFSPEVRPVAELLPEYEEAPAVCVPSLLYGTSGHLEQPSGLVIENFLHRRKDAEDCVIKSIVDPTRTAQAANAHQFVYRDGIPVDENHEPLEDWRTTRPSYRKLRINHYWTMSHEAAERKFQQWSTGRRPRSRKWFQRQLALNNDIRDEAIMPYVPALREAMGQEARSQSGR